MARPTSIMRSRLLVLVALVAVLLQITEAAEHEVGDTTGWQTPSSSNFYSTWASNKNFVVGDTLTFIFSTGVHDVAIAQQSDYNNCNTGNQNNVLSNGPATITLNTTGAHYYFCTFDSHCIRGQKLSINVTGGSSPSPPGTSSPPPSGSTPSPPTTPGAPPPPPSASSSLVATTALMFMSIAITFLCYLQSYM